jgi:hypothetical protein
MKGTIKISVLGIDFEDIKFNIIIENSLCRTSLDFYGYVDDFKTFGKELSEFPKSVNDVVLFQLGEDNRKWAYYMNVKAFCYEASGHSALQVVVDNFGENVKDTGLSFLLSLRQRHSIY